jgi:hypothetical protein
MNESQKSYIKRQTFPQGRLNIGKHKTIEVNVDLKLTWTKFDPCVPNSEDKAEAEGELSFESYPLSGSDHPAKKHATGTLTICGSDKSSKFNIMLMEKSCEKTVIPQHLKKYFWLFCVIGKPIYDRLEIYPEWTQRIMTKAYYCTNFRGLWPVGVSSLVVGVHNMEQAKSILIDELKRKGISQPEIYDLTLEEIDLTRPQAMILNDGVYL